MGLQKIQTVIVYGLSGPKQVVWKRKFSMPGRSFREEEIDLLSFQNRFSSTIIFPSLMAIAILLTLSPLTRFFLRGIQIWFHEFGHATVAWMSGRRAIPLPFGWTNFQPGRSLFVYVGILCLFGLLFWAGWKEQKRWPMILAGVLALIQFCMTWLMPTSTFDMLFSFGGIGGEFYLCALLMIGFFFPLPHYFRWDFYRYPVVIAAAFTFWHNVWFWHEIDRGRQAIPWGTLWGGANDSGGDMQRLLAHGWSNQQIISTYNALSDLCFVAVVGIYLYFLVKENRDYFFALRQRWLTRQ
jgi:hypothetical protein